MPVRAHRLRVTAENLARLRVVADYQFGAGAGAALFPPGEDLAVRRSTAGRPRQVLAATPQGARGVDDGKGETDRRDRRARLVSYGIDGRFTLGVAGGRRLLGAFASPRVRVAVGEESEPFVREGKNAFAKFVRRVDPAVRPGDEVCVVGPDDGLFAVGRAVLPATGMVDFETGMAVKIREGAERPTDEA
ncbi:pseudouridine synthase [Halobacteriales archaeon QS_4_69_34]|nr:MAG: pseudouridine synthase [Halobacteriales archaeon QS_4_69_34]